jgi:hypothetical protein
MTVVDNKEPAKLKMVTMPAMPEYGESPHTIIAYYVPCPLKNGLHHEEVEIAACGACRPHFLAFGKSVGGIITVDCGYPFHTMTPDQAKEYLDFFKEFYKRRRKQQEEDDEVDKIIDQQLGGMHPDQRDQPD